MSAYIMKTVGDIFKNISETMTDATDHEAVATSSPISKSKHSKILDEILGSLPTDIAKYTKKKLTEVIDYEPRIGVMGKTGVGKSSLCNAIFQSDVCPTSEVEACTQTIKELHVDVGDRKLTIVDLPGVGESKEKDFEFKALYEEQVPTLDLILWVIKADDRVLTPDEDFYNSVIKPLKAENKILFVINQADKIEPSHEWDRDLKCPSSAQLQNLSKRETYIYHKLGVSGKGCVAVSVPYNYNISVLVKKMVLRLPKKSKAGVYSTLRTEFKTEEVKSEAKGGFTQVVKDVLDHVIDNSPVPAILKEPLKKGKDYICDKISSFFDSWF